MPEKIWSLRMIKERINRQEEMNNLHFNNKITSLPDYIEKSCIEHANLLAVEDRYTDVNLTFAEINSQI